MILNLREAYYLPFDAEIDRPSVFDLHCDLDLQLENERSDPWMSWCCVYVFWLDAFALWFRNRSNCKINPSFFMSRTRGDSSNFLHFGEIHFIQSLRIDVWDRVLHLDVVYSNKRRKTILMIANPRLLGFYMYKPFPIYRAITLFISGFWYVKLPDSPPRRRSFRHSV